MVTPKMHIGFSIVNSYITYQTILIFVLLVWQNYIIRFQRLVISIFKLYLHQEISCLSRHLLFFVCCWGECNVKSMPLTLMAAIVVNSKKLTARSQNRSQLSEIRLTELQPMAHQVGIMHFCGVTSIKRLPCRQWWIHNWRIVLAAYASCGPHCRDHSGDGLSQWEVMLQCNITSHWLRPYTSWRRLACGQVGVVSH